MNSEQLINAFNAMADAMDANRQHLCDLDGAIGDADHGVTMALGFSAVREAMRGLKASAETPTSVFNTAARSFLNASGGSAGPLFATAFMRAGAAVKGIETVEVAALSGAIQAMAKGVQERGKANPGDKTMLDAWLPAAEAAAANQNAPDAASLLGAVADAAEAGVTATLIMQAKKGRAAKLGERSIGHQDAGAASTALLLRALAESVETSN